MTILKGLMRRILQPFRFITVILIILAFLFTMGCVWLVVRERWRRIWWSNVLLSYFCRATLRTLKFKVTPIGLESIQDLTGALFVSNHLTYTDVLVISSFVPTCFVTSTDIKHTPGLGLICQMAGCLFVDRKNRMNIANEVLELKEGLEHNVNVVIFPEATSGNGEQLLRFRRPLYLAAVQAQKPVLPVCINYRRVGKDVVSGHNHQLICWYGDMDFVPHLWALCGAGGVQVDLNFLPRILPKPEQDPGELAETSQKIVEKVFIPLRKDEGPIA